MYRLGLLACDFVPDDLRDRFDDYPVMFGAAVASVDVDVEWRVYRVFDKELPGEIDECDGYITTGSRSGAYDKDAWILLLEKFIQRLIGSQTPLVGICFGHQVIAQALGGLVKKSEKGWGIGIQRHTIEDSIDRAWMNPTMEQFTIPVCHQDQVTSLPVGARLLASNGHCENFMVQFNDTMLGMQGHPEFDPNYIEVLLELRSKIITGEVREDALRSLSREHNNTIIMQWITNFLGVK
ncbi:MAG TPA: GMP synthase [Gammaproteobacteria bacterium]|nr:GMP synthase [Gammaproteobacteria bacterium]